MKARFDRTVIERVLRPAAVIDVVILIIVALIGLLFVWREIDLYGSALGLIGVAVILAGGVSLFMGPTGIDSATYQPPKGLDTGAHMARVFRSVPSGVGCSFMLITAGFGSLVLGLLLQAVG